MIPAYPLQWPEGWPRTPRFRRKNGRFSKKNQLSLARNLTIADAGERLRYEVGRLGVADGDVVISSNLQLTLSGHPRSGQRDPDDPGIAVYWQIKGAPMRVLAIDAYTKVHDNIAAIAATLEAMRAVERHGGAQILERAFTGFTALPSPDRRWWDVLQVTAAASRTEIEVNYRRLARDRHPDNGGSNDAMSELNRARDEALKARSA
jgi:hypothetical protein